MGQKKGICYIVGAGDFSIEELIAAGINKKEKCDAKDILIAVDGGFDHLKNTAFIPDVIIGDFDSIEDIEEVRSKKVSQSTIITVNKEKDETDTLLAVRHGIEDGYDTFFIFGAMGGTRLDHTIANIQVISYLCNRRKKGFLIDQSNIITAIKDGKIDFEPNFSGRISVFAYSDYAKEVNEIGLKYLVNADDLTSDISRGISNEFVGKQACVSVREGTLLIFLETKNNMELIFEREKKA